uniref:UDP-glycosyltransferases domain-containing protein n=1 Tax=Brassica oleracea TaxID=3712 RepID=A0A3P6GLP7_BRAOL|nr:unnamed protein product [Brassica oleracea]
MTTTKKPHILVIPLPQFGHMLPHIDLTHQLLLRGATITVLVTPKSSPYLDPLRSLHSREHFKTLILLFPSHPSIPSGVETLQQLPLQALPHMLEALSGLHDPLVDFLNHQPPSDLPDVILGSSFLSPWINKVADAFSLKSICFLPINAHAISTMWGQEDRGFFDEFETATTESHGLVVNTFHELEPELVESVTARFMTHHRALTAVEACSEDNSVVYIAYGSQIRLTVEQTAALAAALETSAMRFIWAVRDAAKKVNAGDNYGDDVDVIPAGFEERVKDKGLVIRGWAPQTMILEHRAVGSYLTHLGWGSALEGMVGGVVMLAWPMQADHFYNAKLLIDDLGVAARVGENKDSVPDSGKLARVLADSVKDDFPERVRLMKLREKGMEAIQEGGSSYNNLDELVAEMCV